MNNIFYGKQFRYYELNDKARIYKIHSFVLLLVVSIVVVLLFVLQLFLIFIVTAKNCWDTLIPFRICSAHSSLVGRRFDSGGGGMTTPSCGCCGYGDGLTIDD